MTNNKGISPIYIVLTVFLVAVVSFGIYKYLPNYSKKAPISVESEVVTSLNDELDVYTNNDLKIKFNYPKNIYQETPECKMVSIPVKIDYKKGTNNIFIYPSASLENNCEVKKLTSDEAVTFNDGYWGLKLILANYSNLNELEKILNSTDTTGLSKCSIEKISMDKYKFPIIKEPNGNQMMGDCLAWGGRFNIKVNEEENKVIFESTPRQQGRIANLTTNYKNYDDEIFDSIEFLK